MTRKLKSIISKKYSLISFVLFSIVTLSLATGSKKDNDIDYKEILKPGDFGNLRVVICPSENALIVSDGKDPLVTIEKDESGKIKCSFVSKTYRPAIADVENGKIIKVTVANLETKAFFSIDVSPKDGKSVNAKYYPHFGDAYRDIDFDGQFDVKVLIPKDESKKPIPYIFLDGEWSRMAWVDSDTNEAGVLSAGEKVYYDFEPGKGWKLREVKEKK